MEKEQNALGVLKSKGMPEEKALNFIDGIRCGLKDIHEGRVKPLSKVKAELGLE